MSLSWLLTCSIVSSLRSAALPLQRLLGLDERHEERQLHAQALQLIDDIEAVHSTSVIEVE